MTAAALAKRDEVEHVVHEIIDTRQTGKKPDPDQPDGCVFGRDSRWYILAIAGILCGSIVWVLAEFSTVNKATHRLDLEQSRLDREQVVLRTQIFGELRTMNSCLAQLVAERNRSSGQTMIPPPPPPVSSSSASGYSLPSP